MNARVFIATVIAAVVLAGPAQAATVYTTQASFDAATTATAIDGFDDFDISGETGSPIVRSAGSYSYTASAAGDFWGAGTTSDPWLATSANADPIVFTDFASDIRSIGGFFFGSASNGEYDVADLVLTLVDAAGSTSWSLTGATTDSFVGFVADGAITSLTVSIAPIEGTQIYATVDDLTLGLAARAVPAVPEPATWAMMLIGFGLTGAAMRHRRVSRIAFA